MRRGVAPLAAGTLNDTTVVPPYSVSGHRALIALRCAKSFRPFNMVRDKFYKMEVEMLRPGTHLPHPGTVSKDINHLYQELSKDVRAYFEVRSLLSGLVIK